MYAFTRHGIDLCVADSAYAQLVPAPAPWLRRYHCSDLTLTLLAPYFLPSSRTVCSTLSAAGSDNRSQLSSTKQSAHCNDSHCCVWQANHPVPADVLVSSRLMGCTSWGACLTQAHLHGM
jgi:hypothetical protein